MSKRGNNEGSIRKRTDGRWEGRYTVSTVEGPRRKTLYGKTRKEVSEKLTTAQGNRDGGIVYDSKGQTVGEYLHRWLEDSARGDLAPRTYNNYLYQIDAHINPALGAMKLSKLSGDNIQALYATKLRDGYAAGTIRYTHAVLHRALETAHKRHTIDYNPAATVDPPKVRQDEIEPLSVEQVRDLLQTAKGERLEALYTLALTCGLRIGEILGLKWSDIDLDEGTLRVSRQLQRHRREGSKSGTLEFTEPKNASRRRVQLPQSTTTSLRDHRKRQGEERLAAGSQWIDNGLVFPTTHGSPMDAQNVSNRAFKPLLKKAGLPDMRFHDLRHTCATMLLSKGIHPKYVQELLGHASIALTLDTYSHWMPSMGEHTAQAMDDALYGG